MSLIIPRKAPGQSLLELSQTDLEALMAYGQERHFAKGEEIFLEGEKVHQLWLVKTGRVHLLKSGTGGTESLVAFYGPGCTFCAAATLTLGSYPCSARAAVESDLISIPSDRFNEMVDKLPDFAKHLLKEMAPQFCNAHCECAMNIESVERRLAHTLLRLDAHFEGQSIPFKRAELAQMVNTTPESCIRKLSAWTKEGWLSGSRGKVQVLNRDALKQVLNQD